MLLQQAQGTQGFDAGRGFGGVGKLAGGKGMFVDRYRGIRGLCRDRGSPGMVVGLGKEVSYYNRSDD